MNDPYCIGLDSKDPAEVVLGAAFQSSTVQLRDASIHYVSGGSGPAILFLHGFSEDWYEFSKVMCLLAGWPRYRYSRRLTGHRKVESDASRL